MTARWTLLCVVEAIVVVFLCWQVFGDPRAESIAPPIDEPRTDRDPAGGPLADSGNTPAAHPTPDPVTEPQREAAAAPWNPDDPVGIILTGSLRLRDGSPVDASVYASSGSDGVSGSHGEPGSFALAGLTPGDWQITVRDDSIVELKETVTITVDAIQTRDFVLEASFPVRVHIETSDGKDATTAFRELTGTYTRFSVAGRTERFPERFPPTDYGKVFVGDARWDSERNPTDGFAGTLYLRELPGHVALMMRHLVIDQQVVGPAQNEVKFVVDFDRLQKLLATATVRVLDAETGAPIPKCRVHLSPSNGGGYHAITAENGRATLANITPGLLRCEITAQGREEFFRIVPFERQQEVDLGTIRLGPPVEFRGLVLGPDGEPAHARVRWHQTKWLDGPSEFHHNRSTSPDAEGKFGIRGLGAGMVAIQAFGDGDLVAIGAFPCPASEPAVLRLAEAGTCRFVRKPALTRAFTVMLYNAQRQPIDGYPMEPRRAALTVKLPPGTYPYEVHEGRTIVRSGTMQIGSDPIEVEIR